jgi:beta-mannosidase
LHPNLSTHGNKHIWEVWHGPGDYNNYRWFSPRFCSEFGYQGPPNFSTMQKFYEPAEMKRGSATLELHQKSPGGNERNDRLAQKDFNLPENFDDWHYLLQLNQARALQTGVEWFRSRQPTCMGTLYWQLNDCYPVTSWAAIDGEGRLKPLWFATRRFYAPRLLTIQPEADAIVLYANNDCDEPWQGEATVRRIDFDGKELSRVVLPLDVGARENQRVAVLPTGIVTPTDKTREMVVAEVGEQRAMWFFASDRELVYPGAKPQAALRRDAAAWRLSVSTKTLLRDVVVNIDRLDPQATIDDNVMTLLPGESREFVIHSVKELTLDQLINPPVFQCANRFGKKA